MRDISSENAQAISFFLFLFLIKIGGLLIYGPVYVPEGSNHIRYANILLENSEWLLDINLNHENWASTSLVAIGYPLVIALAKIIGGSFWSWLVVCLQFAVSLIASFFVYRLAKILSRRHWLGLLAAFCHGTGQTVVLDQSIYSSSINDNLLLILACHIGASILDRRRPSMIEMVLLGCVVLVAFLMREFGMYIQVFFWPLIIYWGLTTTGSLIRATAMVMVFVSPLLLGVEAYKSWNEARTGIRYVTHAGYVVYFYPAHGLAKRGVHTVTNDELLADMEPLAWSDLEAPEYYSSIINHLTTEHGFNPLDIQNFMRNYYFKNLIDYPLEMLMITLSKLEAKQLILSFRPMETAIQLRYWATEQWPWPRWGTLLQTIREDADQRVKLITLTAVGGLCRLISVLITLSFYVGVPILIAREAWKNRKNFRAYDLGIMTMFLLWLLYFGHIFTYCQFKLEMRYLMPVEPFATLTGLTIIAEYGPSLYMKILRKTLRKGQA